MGKVLTLKSKKKANKEIYPYTWKWSLKDGFNDDDDGTAKKHYKPNLLNIG